MIRHLLATLVLVLGFSSARAEPRLQLVSAGRGPKRSLRFQFQKNAKRTVEVTSTDVRTRGIDGKVGPAESQPGSRFTFEIEITGVTATGDAQQKLTVLEANALDPSSSGYGGNLQLASLVGLETELVVSSRGVIKDIAVTTPVDRDVVEQTKALMRDFAQELPEVRVGVGATWKVERTVTAGELVVHVDTTYEVLAMDGEQVTLGITQRQRGTGVGAGSLVVEATGQGKTVLDLSTGTAVRSHLDVEQDVALDTGTVQMTQHSKTAHVTKLR